MIRQDVAVGGADLVRPLAGGFDNCVVAIDEVDVIAITANTTVEDRDRCTEVGMIDFVSKPVRRTELARVLKKWRQ